MCHEKGRGVSPLPVVGADERFSSSGVAPWGWTGFGGSLRLKGRRCIGRWQSESHCGCPGRQRGRLSWDIDFVHASVRNARKNQTSAWDRQRIHDVCCSAGSPNREAVCTAGKQPGKQIADVCIIGRISSCWTFSFYLVIRCTVLFT